jgi:hypothetical protein
VAGWPRVARAGPGDQAPRRGAQNLSRPVRGRLGAQQCVGHWHHRRPAHVRAVGALSRRAQVQVYHRGRGTGRPVGGTRPPLNPRLQRSRLSPRGPRPAQRLTCWTLPPQIRARPQSMPAQHARRRRDRAHPGVFRSAWEWRLDCDWKLSWRQPIATGDPPARAVRLVPWGTAGVDPCLGSRAREDRTARRALRNLTKNFTTKRICEPTLRKNHPVYRH